jgi:hypothetical protein
MKRIPLIVVFGLILTFTANIQSVLAQDKTNLGGIKYTTPKGVFPMDWNKSGFKGVLFLEKDSPSGLFIAFANDNETLADLRERAAKFIVPMFLRDKDEKNVPEFQKSSIPNHKGDTGESGHYYSYSNGKTIVQVLFYEREANGKSIIYGYFANNGINEKNSEIWADDKGQGVKIFEKFWSSLSK